MELGRAYYFKDKIVPFDDKINTRFQPDALRWCTNICSSKCNRSDKLHEVEATAEKRS